MANNISIKTNTLYMIAPATNSLQNSQLTPNICVVGGTVNVYGVNSEETPTSLNDMVLPDNNKTISGFASFEICPTYMYCQGTATSIVLTGINVLQELGTF